MAYKHTVYPGRYQTVHEDFDEPWHSRKGPSAWEEIQVPPGQWPDCARCGRRVEGFGVDVSEGRVVFAAVCHGETDVVQVPAADLADAVGEFEFGLAFTGPQRG